MKTAKYVHHTIQRTDGKFINSKREVEAILEAVYAGFDTCTLDDKLVTVFSDKILDGVRTTVVEVT